jgi:hypothetical protein
MKWVDMPQEVDEELEALRTVASLMSASLIFSRRDAE